MDAVIRFGISIGAGLLSRFDASIKAKGYGNRSEALRDLIRNALVEEQWEDAGGETVGTVTLVYDHHTRDLALKLTERQHSAHGMIVSALHVHLDAHNCLEVIVLKGPAQEIKRLADELIGARGVKHGRLVATTSGRELS